jgi:hypothetical protein
MKNLIWFAGIATTVWAAYLLSKQNSPKPVEILAHQLEEAWADHHTTV